MSKACTEWCWSTHTLEEQNWYPSQSSKLQVKAEFTETCPLAAWCSAILSFQTGMDATLLNYMRLGVGVGVGVEWGWGWNGGGGGVGVGAVTVLPMAFQRGAVSTKFFQWCSSVPCCIRWVAQWYPSVHWVNQWHSSGIPVYTGRASVHWLRVRVHKHTHTHTFNQRKIMSRDVFVWPINRYILIIDTCRWDWIEAKLITEKYI